jgi:D-alanine-D-alanine ligase
MNVLILLGGASFERTVSVTTGAAVAGALDELGWPHASLDPFPEGAADGGAIKRIEAALDRHRPDVVFIALHGGAGEDGGIQAVLDLMRVPYTGSGAMASAIAMDKPATKALCTQLGIVTPEWWVLYEGEPFARPEAWNEGGLVVKPAASGSSEDLFVLRPGEDPSAPIETVCAKHGRALVETYIGGRELTVAVVDGAPEPVVEIVPQSGLYDYESKYTAGKTEYVVPADLPERVADQLKRDASIVCRAIGCRGAARVDYRLGDDGIAYCLEVNTVPGMTPTSLLPMAVAAGGRTFPELVAALCRSARFEDS